MTPLPLVAGMVRAPWLWDELHSAPPAWEGNVLSTGTFFRPEAGCSNMQAAGSRGLGMYAGRRVRVASARGL